MQFLVLVGLIGHKPCGGPAHRGRAPLLDQAADRAAGASARVLQPVRAMATSSSSRSRRSTATRCCACAGQAADPGSAHQHRAGTQRHGLEHIGAPANAAYHQHGHGALHGLRPLPTRGRATAAAGAVSSVRPPWLETMTPAAPAATACVASAGCSTPLSSTGRRVMDLSQAMSSQVGAWCSRPSNSALCPGCSCGAGAG